MWGVGGSRAWRVGMEGRKSNGSENLRRAYLALPACNCTCRLCAGPRRLLHPLGGAEAGTLLVAEAEVLGRLSAHRPIGHQPIHSPTGV